MASFVALVEVCHYMLHILNKLIMLCLFILSSCFSCVWLTIKVNRWFYRCLKICKCNDVATFYSQPWCWLAGNLTTPELTMLWGKYWFWGWLWLVLWIRESPFWYRGCLVLVLVPLSLCKHDSCSDLITSPDSLVWSFFSLSIVKRKCRTISLDKSW